MSDVGGHVTFILTHAEEIALALDPYHVCSSEARDLQSALHRARAAIRTLAAEFEQRPFVLTVSEFDAKERCRRINTVVHPSDPGVLAEALERAVRTLAAPVLSHRMFVLLDDEVAACVAVKEAIEIAAPRRIQEAWARVAGALDRAQATLAPPAVDLSFALSEQERAAVEHLRRRVEHGLPTNNDIWILELIDKRLPPEPAKRTPEELAAVVRADFDSDRGVAPSKETLGALGELVALAKAVKP